MSPLHRAPRAPVLRSPRDEVVAQVVDRLDEAADRFDTSRSPRQVMKYRQRRSALSISSSANSVVGSSTILAGGGQPAAACPWSPSALTSPRPGAELLPQRVDRLENAET